ncbi:MAG: hypothetical protein ABL959_05550 [Pyrinomonadaceae bacterium]
MTKPKSTVTAICLTILIAGASISAFAQQEPATTAAIQANASPVSTIYFRNLLLKDIRNAPQPFSTEVAGALRGRVLHESYSVSVVEPQGVSGVRLILRSLENDVQTIVGHRITDADGKYEFAEVLAGKYSLEVDPKSVPTRVRSTGILVSRIGFEASLRSPGSVETKEHGVISGFVFIDKNGNGQYEPGKDKPIPGAHITGNGRFVVSDADGSYVLNDLPTGRTAVLVSLPKKNDNAHMVLDLGPGPAANRILNIPMNR